MVDRMIPIMIDSIENPGITIVTVVGSGSLTEGGSSTPRSLGDFPNVTLNVSLSEGSATNAICLRLSQKTFFDKTYSADILPSEKE